MKQLIISIIVGYFCVAGFSQDQIRVKKKNIATQSGPKIEQVQVKRDYYRERQRSVEKQKQESLKLETGMINILNGTGKTTLPSSYQPAVNVKLKRFLNKDGPKKFSNGNDQRNRTIVTIKKVGHVEGLAPREEIKKIDIHPPVNKKILLQALGNPKPIQKHSVKVK